MTVCIRVALNILIAFILFWTLIAIFFRREIKAVFDRDPAAVSYFEVLLTYSGLHAIIFYRITHWLRRFAIPFFPRWLSQIAK
ncbi:MAG: hypothetical protein KJ584_02660, partial [Candidatus Omnitrophica bacterium]|nr:hypothetical protein [Candidatus Omnitrophota bacterium]